MQDMPELYAVTCLRFPEQTIYLIGALGNMACITGINYQTGIMASILDAGGDGKFQSKGRRSYSFDLRYALGKGMNIAAISHYLTDPDRAYTYGHLIALSDEKSTVILENNITQKDCKSCRAIRTDTSTLKDGIPWTYWDMIAAVNCFMLKGQEDGYPVGTSSPYNTGRWRLLNDNLTGEMTLNKGKLSPDGMMRVMTTISGNKISKPKKGYASLYNTSTQQIILFTPSDRSMKIFFKPKDNSTPLDPVPLFFEVPLKP
jgi:hypothetical protein